ncbi:phospholipase D-like domain-containing protein [Brevundimonas sp. SORGH_AS_0993]|uniref:phospholipase D-like domain-containing protein n=1 Tax=Brevundimonas sp. SORGH_AS_0993 TaxID=3041794 RepID=UPI00278A840F|nr:phospholipase D-like domain-containing protein [Brevundimonas sp. SORGH_AS_0993]MDQ1153813.1 phosphatidylserine/phosphatidylglycerophosphate/cardiolipin synthase-like enzyme [Brevundimonas sp. SORGH_AS_0993]
MTMDTARAEVLYRLEQADKYNRFFAFAPRTAEGDRIIVHAKVSIIDDRFLRIGSTNLNNRSMGLDTECDVAMEPTDAAGRQVIVDHRHHTIAHWIGVKAEAFAAVEAVMGATGKAICSFQTDRLVPLGSEPPTRIQRMFAEWQLGDPMSSSDAWRPWKRLNRSQRTRPRSEGGQAPG